ncbi:MinD/ParA family protein [Streptomyces sp. NPDC007264]|uniref:MinD/ParA family ATP-binding protein n=1 Tax=Streptomyces sp. NPDC007264 TaxID=3364777 RepID=UPI0036DD857C
MSENSAFGASSAADQDEDELPPSHARTLPASGTQPSSAQQATVHPAGPAPSPAHAPSPAPGPAPVQRPPSGREPAPGPAATPAPAPLPGPAGAPAPAPAPLPNGSSPNPYVNPYAGQYQPPSPAVSAISTDAQRSGLLRLVGRGGARSSGPEQQRLARLQTPVPRPYRISVTSIKGGVGKTTTSAMLGLTFAHYRADRTVVIDANPHAGTLADRLLGERIMPTVRDLVGAERHRRALGGQGLTDPLHIHQYLGQADRLMVAASEQSPDISELFDEEQYRTAQDVLTRAFDIVVTDSGTGMKHSAMKGTLATTDRLIVVAAPRFDAARRAAKTLDEVYAQGYPHLVRDAVVVITMDAPKAVGINMNTLVDYFQQLCTHVVRVPYDQHLYAGGTIQYDRVSPTTRGAYMDLAALLADGFGNVLPGR